MNCKQIASAFVSYLDGRAAPDERRKVEAHLETCAACRTRAEEFGKLWNVLDEDAAIQPSPSFDARLRQRIAAEPVPNRWAWLMPRPAFAMALLLAVSIWIGRLPSEGPVAKSDEDFHMIKDLRVLENYDVLSNFDVLSELPPVQPSSPAQPPAQSDQTQDSEGS
jgi:anti-sigma factor RsiW